MEDAEVLDSVSPPERESAWDLMLGVLVSPGEALAQVARERRVVPAAAILVGLSLFTMVVGVLSSRGTEVVGAAEFAEVPLDPALLQQLARRFAMVGSVLGAVMQLLWWFVRSAVYRLLGELMGSEGDGTAMLAALGFAAMPGLLEPPLQLAARSLGLLPLSILFGLAFWVWTSVLSILAIRAALNTGTGRALAIFAIPWAVLAGFVVLMIFTLGLAFVGLG